MHELDAILAKLTDLDASDVHLKAGEMPRFRLGGRLEECDGFDELTPHDIDRMVGEILSREQELRFEAGEDIDLCYGRPALGRFRGSLFRDQLGSAAVFHRLPATIPTTKELGLPAAVAGFTRLRGGLVLISGSPGSRVGATLTALVDETNRSLYRHVITLEEPVEFVHESQHSLIHQRAIGVEAPDFRSGLAEALRADPDVVVIAELRDSDTTRLALAAAESGVLVFAGVNEFGAPETVRYLVEMFAPADQPLIRTMLSQSLEAVVSQLSLERGDAAGHVLAAEVLVANSSVRGLIRNNKLQDILTVIQSGKRHGMQALDDSLEMLVSTGALKAAAAARHARSRARFDPLILAAGRS